MQTNVLVKIASSEVHLIPESIATNELFHSTIFEITDKNNLVYTLTLNRTEILNKTADVGFDEDTHAEIKQILIDAGILDKVQEGISRTILYVEDKYNHANIKSLIGEKLKTAPIAIAYVDEQGFVTSIGSIVAIAKESDVVNPKDFGVIVEHPTSQDLLNKTIFSPTVVLETINLGKLPTSIYNAFIYDLGKSRHLLNSIKEGH